MLPSLEKKIFRIELRHLEDVPGGPVVKTLPSNAGGAGSIPGQEAKIPYASESKTQSIKQCGAAWGWEEVRSHACVWKWRGSPCPLGSGASVSFRMVMK